ncbi:predicted protein [Streptomyces filamentosus NRRL 15998]|uniref:Predicted protein n=1 Tax=Streptomyces filamentosus NRRL 15998 TaxID=457431 RepID=D6ATS9_STRFL|nr:predicted protein [Streptomyces filamentosus NRRL 15998]
MTQKTTVTDRTMIPQWRLPGIRLLLLLLLLMEDRQIFLRSS